MEFFWNTTKLVSLYIVRMVLGLTCGICYLRLTSAIYHRFGLGVSRSFLIISLVQFHLLFYLSRPLPNILAMPFILIAQALWIEQKNSKIQIFLLVFTTVIFRCDILLFLAPFILHILITQKISILNVILTGFFSGIFSLVLTVLIDGFFWGRWLWPEGEVLFFNTILNKSPEWGVMPFHWYFSSAIPRALQGTIFLAFYGFFAERRIRGYFFVVLIWIFLYSFLGHKELRFIFGAIPIFNLVSATGLNRLWINRRKHLSIFLIGVFLLLISFFGTILITTISIHNYPGGYALKKLHKIENFDPFFYNQTQIQNFQNAQNAQNVQNVTHQYVQNVRNVHISVFPAMTGVSRFGELENLGWNYSKTENIRNEDFQFLDFDFLLSEERKIDGFEMIQATKGYGGFNIFKNYQIWLERIKLRQFPFLELKLQDQVFLHKRKINQTNVE